MKLELILDAVQRMPAATFALILFMSLSASLLVNHILKVGVYTTMATVPTLLLAGVFAHAAFVAHGIAISPDKASNTAIAASAGFIAVAAVILVLFRMYVRLNDRH